MYVFLNVFFSNLQGGSTLQGAAVSMRGLFSRIKKRVVNTKIVRRAAEKMSSYPLVLTVEVKKLNGILAVNIAPPPSDTVW